VHIIIRRYLPKGIICQNKTKKNPYADVNPFLRVDDKAWVPERGRYGKNQPIRYAVCPRAAYADEQHSEAIELKRLAGDRVFKTEYDTIILYSKRP